MDLDSAIELLKNVVKNNSTNDENHFDLTIVPASERKRYEKALVISQIAIKEGKISKDEFLRRVQINQTKLNALHDNLSYRAHDGAIMYLFLLTSLSLFAAEVVTLSKTVSNQDVRILVTDNDLMLSTEKTWASLPCKLRWSSNLLGQKEFWTPETCRAELMKTLLNAGYKPLDNRTFIK